PSPGRGMGGPTVGDLCPARRTIMKQRRVGLLSLTAVVTAGVLSGCGLCTAGGFVPSGQLAGPMEGTTLEGAEVSVGSKDFTEQIILGKMAVIHFQSSCAYTQVLTTVPGSHVARMAML